MSITRKTNVFLVFNVKVGIISSTTKFYYLRAAGVTTAEFSLGGSVCYTSKVQCSMRPRQTVSPAAQQVGSADSRSSYKATFPAGWLQKLV